jgi:hypothetical protein
LTTVTSDLTFASIDGCRSDIARVQWIGRSAPSDVASFRHQWIGDEGDGVVSGCFFESPRDSALVFCDG